MLFFLAGFHDQQVVFAAEEVVAGVMVGEEGCSLLALYLQKLKDLCHKQDRRGEQLLYPALDGLGTAARVPGLMRRR